MANETNVRRLGGVTPEFKHYVRAFGHALVTVRDGDDANCETFCRLWWLAQKLDVGHDELFKMLSGASFADYTLEDEDAGGA